MWYCRVRLSTPKSNPAKLFFFKVNSNFMTKKTRNFNTKKLKYWKRLNNWKFQPDPFTKGSGITVMKCTFSPSFLLFLFFDKATTSQARGINWCAIFPTYSLSSSGVPFGVCVPQTLKRCVKNQENRFLTSNLYSCNRLLWLSNHINVTKLIKSFCLTKFRWHISTKTTLS